MPIIPPTLDDRRFDDLVDDLIARIPAHTPEWTNPRLGDPGRTLIELFAWLGDTLLYRANLIPERQRLVFLKLLGISLKPARPAQGVVSLSFAQSTELAAATIAPGALVAGAVPFETLDETTVLPVSAEAYIKRRLSDAEAVRMGDVIQGLAQIHGIAGEATAYETSAIYDGGRAKSNGVDVDVFAASVDRALWIALLAPPASRGQDQSTVNDTVRLALGGGDSGAPSLLSVGMVPALKMPELFQQVDAPAPVPVLWEITTRGRSEFDTDYLTLDAVSDSTNGLARPGVLRLELPDESYIWAPSNDIDINARAGVGDTPPRLDDESKAQRLLAWIRLRPKPGELVNSLPLAWIGINAVSIDQRVTLGRQVLGVSNGAADQIFQLPRGSVDPETLVIEVEEPGRGYQRWDRVDDLAALGVEANLARDARAYELDAEAGTVRFGDGVRGCVPERQMRVRLAKGRFGGGRAGNLAAGSLTEANAKRIDGSIAPALKVLQPLPADGGEDAETIEAAQRRIPAVLRHRDRAVTPEDYRRLAMETPGVDVARVEVLPRFKPRDRRFNVPGVVSVMALPAQALSMPPNPRPDRPFIERVHSHLSARAPLSTELYVIGCEYIALGLSVGVAIRDGHARDKVLLEVREALKVFLWPLPPGGLEDKGWPLGRPVRERELEVEISRVPGVLEVRGLNMFARHDTDGASDWLLLPRNNRDGTQTLELAAWQLPELLSVIVADGDAPSDLRALPNPFAQANAVAVPVVPDFC
jgi:predicted phage baseplate assembly protein